MRVNINLNEELVKKIDEAARKMYVSRSAYISFAVSQRIQLDFVQNKEKNVVGKP